VSDLPVDGSYESVGVVRLRVERGDEARPRHVPANDGSLGSSSGKYFRSSFR
jgi:hypothetical protein